MREIYRLFRLSRPSCRFLWRILLPDTNGRRKRRKPIGLGSREHFCTGRGCRLTHSSCVSFQENPASKRSSTFDLPKAEPQEPPPSERHNPQPLPRRRHSLSHQPTDFAKLLQPPSFLRRRSGAEDAALYGYCTKNSCSDS